MRFFDAHCDTIQKVVEKGIDLAAVNAASHVTLPGMVSLVLDDRIGSNGCAMPEEGDVFEVDPGLLDSVDHAHRLVIRGG